MRVRLPPTASRPPEGLESLWTREDVALLSIYAREAEGVCDRDTGMAAASLTVRMFAQRSVSWRRVVDRHV